MSAPDRTLLEEALPGYEIHEEIGRGGWGVVVEATHRKLGRRVAVKQLPRAFGADPQVRQRFDSEARLLAQLQHPHIVPVYDFVEYEGLCLFVMELLPGGTVWDRMTGDGLAENGCAIALATCSGLSYAHEHRILHRDVKPENLVFSTTDVVKVTDFGISKVLGGGYTLGTAAGEVLGSPAYIAPEQILGNELSPATDLYALATMLYEMLAGVLPFPGHGGSIALLLAKAREEAIPLTDVAEVGPRLADVVMGALATEPVHRPETALEFGVGLIDAANAELGSDWLDRSGVTVQLMGDLAHAARTSTPAPGAPAPETELEPVVAQEDESGNGARSSVIVSRDPVNLVPLRDLFEPDDMVETTLFVVEVSEPDLPPRRVALREPLDVGREASGIQLDDPETSRHHLRLEPLAEDVRVIDLASTNGTRVNGKAITQPTTVRVGAVVALGKSSLRIVSKERRTIPRGTEGEVQIDLDAVPSAEADDEATAQVAVTDDERSRWRRRHKSG